MNWSETDSKRSVMATAKKRRLTSSEPEPDADNRDNTAFEGVQFLCELGARRSSERAALLAFFRKAGGLAWYRSDGWGADTGGPTCGKCSRHHGEPWFGVRVDSDGLVIALDLHGNNLSGKLIELVPELLRLPQLRELDLSANSLTGPMPPALLQMTQLRRFKCGRNQLSGAFSPEFSEKLELFDCAGNSFTRFWRGESRVNFESRNTINTFVLRNKDQPLSCLSSAAKTASNVVAAAFNQDGSEFQRLWTVTNIYSAIPKASCTAIIEAAEAWAAANSGWTTTRHGVYNSTTDIPVGRSEALLALVNRAIERTIFPAMAYAFGFLCSELWMQDCFVAKYDMGGQRSLRPHLDGSDLSFVCALNLDFEGGGTLFHLPEGRDVLVRQRGLGDVWMFCGQHLHSGVSITSGQRYILAGLVKVHTHNVARRKVVRRIRQGFKHSKRKT